MHTIELIAAPDRKGRAAKHHFRFPGSWEECLPEQLGDLAILTATGLDAGVLKFRALQLLAGIPARLFDAMRFTDLIAQAGEKAVLLPQLDWLLQPPAYAKSVVPLLTVGSQRYDGPRDALGNFTLLQFSFADHCLARIGEAPDDTAVAELLGALYVPAGMPWDNEGIEARGRKLATLPARIKLAAMLNYRALRAGVVAMYPLTFEGGDSDGYGIDGLLEGYAGEKFGTVDQVGAKPLHPALVHSERAIRRKNELEEEIKAIQRK